MTVTEDLAPNGTLRASINLGNPVLAQGTPTAPSGITVDIAAEVARRLNVPVQYVCFDAARKSFEAVTENKADLCFLAIEPAREGDIAFTAPYVVIEGVFAVPQASKITATEDVDRPDVRIGVKQGSAYDLFLTRTVKSATIVRGEEGVDEFLAQGLEVAAGIRQPMTEFVAAHPEFRLLDGRFMQIQQAVGTAKDKRPETVQFLRELVDELKANGFVADSLRRADQDPAIIAP